MNTFDVIITDMIHHTSLFCYESLISFINENLFYKMIHRGSWTIAGNFRIELISFLCLAQVNRESRRCPTIQLSINKNE